jgi:hypothetical protein
MLVNRIHTQLAVLARAIVTAADNKISASEGLQLGMQGMLLASHVATIIEGADAQTRREILRVLEDGQLVLPQ